MPSQGDLPGWRLTVTLTKRSSRSSAAKERHPGRSTSSPTHMISSWLIDPPVKPVILMIASPLFQPACASLNTR